MRIADGLTWTFGYDHRNQLIWTERRTSDGGSLELRLDYRYDVFARRIEESRWESPTNTTVTRFGHDGADVLVDLDGANVLQVRYVRPDGIDALGARASAAGLVAWYFTDLRGSVIALTDGNGVLRSEVAYDGFGNIVSETDPGFSDRYKYTGREWQEDLGWNYHRRRWYDPATGTWTTEDPIRITAGDYNYYRYAGNGPTNATDPSGLAERDNVRIDLLLVAQSLRQQIETTLKNRIRAPEVKKVLSEHVKNIKEIESRIGKGSGLRYLEGQIILRHADSVLGPQARSDSAPSRASLLTRRPGPEVSPEDREKILMAQRLSHARMMLAVAVLAERITQERAGPQVPGVRGLSPAEVRAWDAQERRGREQVKEMEAREATRAAIQRSLHRTMPFGPAPDWDVIHRVDRRYRAEDARRRAARSPEKQLYAFALEQVMLLALGAVAGSFARLGRVNRLGIIDDLGATVQPHVKSIRSIAPDAQVGFRGSLARGRKGPHKGNAPFDPTNFDVDAFIVSDSLAAKFHSRTRFRAGNKIPEIAGIQKTVDSSLRKYSTFVGLRQEPFTFRIFTRAEMETLLKKGDLQIFFLPGQ